LRRVLRIAKSRYYRTKKKEDVLQEILVDGVDIRIEGGVTEIDQYGHVVVYIWEEWEEYRITIVPKRVCVEVNEKKEDE